jgi:hypothetical protein
MARQIAAITIWLPLERFASYMAASAALMS